MVRKLFEVGINFYEEWAFEYNLQSRSNRMHYLVKLAVTAWCCILVYESIQCVRAISIYDSVKLEHEW